MVTVFLIFDLTFQCLILDKQLKIILFNLFSSFNVILVQSISMLYPLEMACDVFFSGIPLF